MVRSIFFLVLTILMSALCLLLVYLLASLFIRLALVEPEDGSVDIEDWASEYIKWAGLYGIGITALGNLLWYVLAQWVFHVDEYKKSEKRKVWISFFLFPIAGVIISLMILVFNPIQSGIPWVVLFSLVPILCYWITTLLFSPSSFKYNPWGASAIRHW
jgi:hypothetical protein